MIACTAGKEGSLLKPPDCLSSEDSLPLYWKDSNFHTDFLFGGQGAMGRFSRIFLVLQSMSVFFPSFIKK